MDFISYVLEFGHKWVQPIILNFKVGFVMNSLTAPSWVWNTKHTTQISPLLLTSLETANSCSNFFTFSTFSNAVWPPATSFNFLSTSAFCSSNCSVFLSAFLSLNDSIRQFLFVCSSSFFSEVYSSACSSLFVTKYKKTVLQNHL